MCYIKKVTEYQGTEKDNNGYTVYEYDMPDYIQGNSARSAQEFSAWYNGDSGGDYNMDENVYTPKGYGNLIRKTIHQKWYYFGARYLSLFQRWSRK